MAKHIELDAQSVPLMRYKIYVSQQSRLQTTANGTLQDGGHDEGE